MLTANAGITLSDIYFIFYIYCIYFMHTKYDFINSLALHSHCLLVNFMCMCMFMEYTGRKAICSNLAWVKSLASNADFYNLNIYLQRPHTKVEERK